MLDKAITIQPISANNAGSLGLFMKYRVQVPIVVLTTFFLQYAIASVIYSSTLLPQNVYASLNLTIAANLGGLFLYRKMRLYPSTERMVYIIPSFVLSWATTTMVITLLRLPYSALNLVIGLSLGMVLTVLIDLWSRRVEVTQFCVVPSMRVTNLLAQTPWISCTVCVEPEDIANSVGSIVVDLHADLSDELEKEIANATLAGRQVYHVKQISESLTGRVQIDHLSENALGTLAPDESYAFIKSCAERILAVVALLLTTPILFAVALVIKLDSSGPILFRQTRVGFRGERFTIFKLRTMVQAKAPRSRDDDITVKDDPRITRVGRFLRHSRLDELPQLINIIRGEMSWIGPRPETERLSEWYAGHIDFYAYRHVVLPGVTGWAQVNQGHVSSTDEVFKKLQYDLYYIKHFSIWLDIVIVLQTVKVMLLKFGAK